MKKKLLAVTLSAAMTAALLAGCGLASTGSSADTVAEDVSADAGADGSSDTADADGKIHLEYFNVKSEVTGIYDALIEKFEEENPDIEIEQVNVPDPTTVLQTRMSTGDMPDILSHWATDPVFKEMVNNDMLVDLTDQDFMKNVKPDMLDGVEYDGKAYCLPISTNAAGIFYNKDIFNQNGLEVPITYEELIADCQKLKDAGMFRLHSSIRILIPDRQWSFCRSVTFRISRMPLRRSMTDRPRFRTIRASARQQRKLSS